jgi:hypothetical protein
MESPDPVFRCGGSFRVMNAPQLHDEIEKALGPATHSHTAGSEKVERPGKFWKNDIWILDSPLPKERQIHEHLKWLSDFLTPHEPVIARWISQGAKVDLFFSYSCSDNGRGFGVPGKYLGIFDRLDIPFEVSVAT